MEPSTAYYPLAEVSKLLPGRPSIPTIWRWRTKGVRGVHLETVMIGGRRFVTQDALQRFISGVTAVSDGQPAEAMRTPKQRERAIARAEAELRAAGI